MGVSYDLELQLLHASNTGELAAIGILFAEYEKASKVLSALFNSVPELGEKRELELNLMDLIPARRVYYSYSGSQTTPPCQEGYSWFVFEDPMPISQKQLDIVNEHIGNNARPIQATRGRNISKSLR